MTPEQQHELAVQKRLRAVAIKAVLIGAAMLLLSFVRVRITDAAYQHHVEQALDVPQQLWIVLAVLPAGWVLRAPRRRRVLGWAAWFAATGVGLQLLAPTAEAPAMIDPFWVHPLLTVLLVCLAALVVVVLPIIRLLDPEPPGLPTARIYRGE